MREKAVESTAFDYYSVAVFGISQSTLSSDLDLAPDHVDICHVFGASHLFLSTTESLEQLEPWDVSVAEVDATSVGWALALVPPEQRTHKWYAGYQDHDRGFELAQNHGEDYIRCFRDVAKVQLPEKLLAIDRDSYSPATKVSSLQT